MNGDHDEAVDREVLLAANEDAAQFYRGQLCMPTNAGPRDYVVARGFRTLLEETPWTVGYAPTGRTSLVDHLAAQGYSDATVLNAGLACRTRHDTLVDRFRDRIIFGIRNAEGELVAFTARCSPSAPGKVPKYLNTPSTALYNKSATPFGLGEQCDSIRDGAVPVLVEGPFDALAVNTAQEESERSFAALALCGTTLSGSLVDCLALLNSRSVLLAFDCDDAGNLATERAAVDLSAKFRDVRAITRRNVGDPAEVLARSGAPALRINSSAQRRPPFAVSARASTAGPNDWTALKPRSPASASSSGPRTPTPYRRGALCPPPLRTARAQRGTVTRELAEATSQEP